MTNPPAGAWWASESKSEARTARSTAGPSEFGLDRLVDQLNSDPREAEPAGQKVFEVFSGICGRR
jgi:hypothetical protein